MTFDEITKDSISLARKIYVEEFIHSYRLNRPVFKSNERINLINYTDLKFLSYEKKVV